MQYQGLVLNLEAFQGDVALRGSTFEDNLFRFQGCEILEADPSRPGWGVAVPAPDLRNNFKFIFRAPTDPSGAPSSTTFDRVQIKALINVLAHPGALVLANNTF
jgi:hypothetical protein